jgi:hypothetical protein
LILAKKEKTWRWGGFAAKTMIYQSGWAHMAEIPFVKPPACGIILSLVLLLNLDPAGVGSRKHDR